MQQKGIIIIDLPESCCDCIFSDYYGRSSCLLEGGQLNDPAFFKRRPSWCPIRILPGTEKTKEYFDSLDWSF